MTLPIVVPMSAILRDSESPSWLYCDPEDERHYARPIGASSWPNVCVCEVADATPTVDPISPNVSMLTSMCLVVSCLDVVCPDSMMYVQAQ